MDMTTVKSGLWCGVIWLFSEISKHDLEHTKPLGWEQDEITLPEKVQSSDSLETFFTEVNEEISSFKEVYFMVEPGLNDILAVRAEV